MAYSSKETTYVRTGTRSGDANLQMFDVLCFQGWNNQDLDLLEEIHSPDLIVHYADGSKTEGFDAHKKWAQRFFAAFDSHIEAHPIKTATDDWTSVMGEIEITFARPFVTDDGTVIPPTQKTWTGRTCSLCRWKKGRISEKILFWDHGGLMKAVGMA